MSLRPCLRRRSDIFCPHQQLPDRRVRGPESGIFPWLFINHYPRLFRVSFDLCHFHYRSASAFDICVLQDCLTFTSQNYSPSERSYAETQSVRRFGGAYHSHPHVPCTLCSLGNAALKTHLANRRINNHVACPPVYYNADIVFVPQPPSNSI